MRVYQIATATSLITLIALSVIEIMTLTTDAKLDPVLRLWLFAIVFGTGFLAAVTRVLDVLNDIATAANRLTFQRQQADPSKSSFYTIKD